MNSEYFDPVGLGTDMDEHSGVQEPDQARMTVIRRTMNPTSSNHSFAKNNSQSHIGQSQTPLLYAKKKKSTPFLADPDAYLKEMAHKINTGGYATSKVPENRSRTAFRNNRLH